MVGFGASSGGAFVLQLAERVPFAAIVSQIMAIPPHLLPPKMPPVLFVHMPRDARTAALVAKCLKKLPESRELRVEPQPPTPSFLTRIDGVTEEIGKQVVSALATAGLLEAGSGLLAADPRGSPWRGAIAAAPGLASRLPGARPGVADSLRADESALSEVLNVAWAAHEITSDRWGETLSFVKAALARRQSSPVEAVQAEL